MSNMFSGCSSLMNLNLSNFQVKDDIQVVDMFSNCFSANAILICSGNLLNMLDCYDCCLLETYCTRFFILSQLFCCALNRANMDANTREMGLKITSEQIPSFLGCKIFDNNDKTKYKCTVKKLKSDTRILENVTVYNAH